MNLHRVLPQRVPASDGRDYAKELAAEDNAYLPQLSVGNVAQLHFPAPAMEEGMQQSVFLHARGYHELIRDYEGWPKISELNKFRVPGYFSDYSKMRYLQVLGDEAEYLVAKD